MNLPLLEKNLALSKGVPEGFYEGVSSCLCNLNERIYVYIYILIHLGQAKVSGHMWEEEAVVATLFVCFSLENIPAIDLDPCYFW